MGKYNRSIQNKMGVHTHRWDFACMAVLPRALAAVAMDTVIPVFWRGPDVTESKLTTGGFNLP